MTQIAVCKQRSEPCSIDPNRSSQPWAALTRIDSRAAVDNLIICHDNLLKVLRKQVHMSLNYFLEQIYLSFLSTIHLKLRKYNTVTIFSSCTVKQHYRSVGPVCVAKKKRRIGRPQIANSGLHDLILSCIHPFCRKGW
jgi:hypothetical protein